MENPFPKRKHPRLKNFEYNTSGIYFITICAQDRKPLFSHVGRGLAPAEKTSIDLSPYGKIIEEELLSLQKRFSCITIGKAKNNI